MTLMLHVGAQPTDYDGLHALITPPPTTTHVPIPHFRVVDMLKHTLAFYGHEVTAEHFGVTEDGMRFFGLLSLKSSYGGYEDTVALRLVTREAELRRVGYTRTAKRATARGTR